MTNPSDRHHPPRTSVPDPSITMPPVVPFRLDLDSVVPLEVEGTINPLPDRAYVSNPPTLADRALDPARTAVPLWGWGLVGMLFGLAISMALISAVSALLAFLFLG